MSDTAINFQQSAMKSLQHDLNEMVRELVNNKCYPISVAKYTLSIMQGNEFFPIGNWNYRCEEKNDVGFKELEYFYQDLVIETLSKAATELAKLFFTMNSLEVQVTWINRAYDESDAFGVGGFRVEVEVIPRGHHYHHRSEKQKFLPKKITPSDVLPKPNTEEKPAELIFDEYHIRPIETKDNGRSVRYNIYGPGYSETETHDTLASMPILFLLKEENIKNTKHGNPVERNKDYFTFKGINNHDYIIPAKNMPTGTYVVKFDVHIYDITRVFEHLVNDLGVTAIKCDNVRSFFALYVKEKTAQNKS